MIKRIGFVLSILVIGVALGVGSALFMISRGTMIGAVDNSYWRTSSTIGSTDADPYTRALIARIGLLGLNQNETIYYNRTRDDAGDTFDAACTYRIEGGAMAARWWSITLYAPDNYLAQNGDGAPSIDATSIEGDEQGRWQASVSPRRADAAHWISSKNADAFSLSLRLYNPEAAIREHMGDVALPSVTRVSCGEGGQ